MKTLLKTVALLSASVVLHSNAAITTGHSTETSFIISGSIQPQCKINSAEESRASDLDLTSAVAQAIATVEIWCNTSQSTARTTYSSINDGVLKNGTHAGKDIAYRMNVSGNNDTFDLTSARSINQASASGINGESESRTISIIPTVNGLEYEGTYTDTITVTVALN